MNKWPKNVPELTENQKAIKTDWIAYWLTTYGQRFGMVEKFNHTYAANNGFFQNCKTLEVGAGLGDHLKYEDYTIQDYTAVEIEPDYASIITKTYPLVKTIVGNCQEPMPFEDNYFDRILAIHVLEHLPNLPVALDEFSRILKNDGKLIVVVPCEGGLLYSLSRKISSKRMFEKRYGQNYDWLIQSDHLNDYEEVMFELNMRFKKINVKYFPVPLPSYKFNLCVGLTMEKINS